MSPSLFLKSNSSPTIVLFVSLLSFPKLLIFFHHTKFFYFIFLFVWLLFLCFFQFWKLWMRPSTFKVSKSCKSKQQYPTFESYIIKQHHYVFYTFPFSLIFLLSILQNTMIKFFIWISPLHWNRKITTSHPSCETRSCQNFQPLNVSPPFPSFFLYLLWCLPTL